MRNVRSLRMFGYGASLALVVALAAPGVPNDIGGSHTAFAQGTGQPAPGQPAPGQPGSGDQGAGQTPNQAPGVTTETTSGPNQTQNEQQGTGTSTQQQGSGTGTGTGTQQQGTGTGAGTTTQQGTGMGTGTQQQGPTRDPMRGGVEVPGQPACYMPALNVTERRPYNMFRPACFGQLQ